MHTTLVQQPIWSTHLRHRISRDAWFPIISANRITLNTSLKELANPRLILTTPSSRPRACSISLCVAPGHMSFISSSVPRRAAAPPGLHIQPVRSEMDCSVAAYSMNLLGIISPLGCRHLSWVQWYKCLIYGAYIKKYQWNSGTRVGLFPYQFESASRKSR